MNILVSACLLGVCCRYNGTGEENERVKRLGERHRLIPVCPEIYGWPRHAPPAGGARGRAGADKGRHGCDRAVRKRGKGGTAAGAVLWLHGGPS